MKWNLKEKIYVCVKETKANEKKFVEEEANTLEEEPGLFFLIYLSLTMFYDK